MTERSLQTRLLLACLGAMAVFAILLASWLISAELTQDDSEAARSLAQSTEAAAASLAESANLTQLAQKLQFLDHINRQLADTPSDAAYVVLAAFEGGRRVWAGADWPENVHVPPDSGSFYTEAAGRTWRGHRGAAGAYSLVQMVDLDKARSTLAPIVVRDVLLYVGLGFCAVSAALVLALRTGLRPLRTLAAEIAQRSPTDPRPYAIAPEYRELAPLVRALNETRRRDADSRARERELIQETAHALSTPLMALEQQAAAIRRENGREALDPQLDRLVNTAARSNRIGRQLMKLAILDAEPTLEPQEFDVMDVLREALAEIEEAARRIDTVIELEGPERLSVRADATTLRCIIDNLLSNAVRYGAGGRGIKVCAEADGVQLRIAVADDGPGISESMRDAVFEPFRRGPKARHDGAGLGLAIVRRAAGKMGARVDLSTCVDRKGCVVALVLPL